MPCYHQPGLACVTWETSTNDIFKFSSSTGTSVVTLAKCFNDGNIFRGLFHRALSLCHRPSRVVPVTIHPVFAPAGFQREHLMNLCCALHFLWRVPPPFWRQQRDYMLLAQGLDQLAPETRCLEAARLPTAVVIVLKICLS